MYDRVYQAIRERRAARRAANRARYAALRAAGLPWSPLPSSQARGAPSQPRTATIPPGVASDTSPAPQRPSQRVPEPSILPLTAAADQAIREDRAGPHRWRGGIPSPTQLAQWRSPDMLAAATEARAQGAPGETVRVHRRGQPRGATIVTQESIASLARQHGADMLAALVDIAESSASQSARVAAAQAVLDRGYGRPSGDGTTVQVGVQVGQTGDAAWLAAQPTGILRAGRAHPELLAAYRHAETPEAAVAALSALLGAATTVVETPPAISGG